jgi:hypothetical protein
MTKLQDPQRKYRRYRHDIREKAFLQLNGLQHVLSSNVSAVGTKGDALVIRFHNGSVYEYPGKATDLEKILASNSKGKWVWRFLRRSRAFYKKTGVIPLPDDLGVTDEEIFQEIDNRYFNEVTQYVEVPVFQSFEFIQGINMQKIDIGDLTVYKPITSPLPLAEEQQPIIYDDQQFESYAQLVSYLKKQELTESEIEDVLTELKVDAKEIEELLQVSFARSIASNG